MTAHPFCFTKWSKSVTSAGGQNLGIWRYVTFERPLRGADRISGVTVSPQHFTGVITACLLAGIHTIRDVTIRDLQFVTLQFVT